MSSKSPSSTEIAKAAETIGLAVLGVGAAILLVGSPKFRQKLGESLGQRDADASPKQPQQTPRTRTDAPVPGGGVVYLLKAGPFYKIGKATDFSRRLNQIKLQLPYEVVVSHTIVCDDISHVETYWHRRFASRRQNGEWFVLSDEDVAQFKANTRM